MKNEQIKQCCKDLWEVIDNLQNKITELESKSQWISVEDGLPITESQIIKDNLKYMTVDVICFDGNLVFQCEFRAGNTIEFWSGFDSENITHWMPLPAPPSKVKLIRCKQ